MWPFAPDVTVGSILDGDRDLSTFNNFVRHTGLIKELDGEGPFTVFAPTNAAFDLLPPGTLGALTSDVGKLRTVIAYHIVKGEISGASIREADHLQTLHGDPLLVTAADEGVVVGGAGLEEIDLPGVNGVVHKIDAVMFPGG